MAKTTTEPMVTVFGTRLRALREAAGLTQEQLANASGFDHKHIGSLERADRAASFEAVEKLAAALGVQYYELFLPTDLSFLAGGRGGDQNLRLLIREVERHGSPALKQFLTQAIAAAVTLAKSDDK